ncbi:hypothetical protein U14_00275 [Candidatus Moduliflexus flocculans]|uniref:Uncharacterized protein n=1 Tax=Candidatus Moduliflexus flocculans TaxID=1499966 RepID=A0A0S6VUY8_9BACT|nr:hypothetical protein U14_00275 [Candidatus Moduliflexus flocculans]
MMKTYSTILIEKSALPSIQESLALGKRILEQKLATYQRRLREFEATFKFDTSTFAERFENGELGDDKVWFVWDHARSAVAVLEKKLHDLETVRYEA